MAVVHGGYEIGDIASPSPPLKALPFAVRGRDLVGSIGRWPAGAGGCIDKWCGEAGDDLDQIGLPARPGFLEQIAEMGFGRAVGDAEFGRDLGYATDVHDR